MAEVILVYGKSGSGKSRSLINFEEDEILLINTIGKRVPFAKKFKYVLNGDSYATIKGWMSKMTTKIAVIDDAGYLMSNEWMREHSKPKSGASSFEMYNKIADSFWDLVNFCKALPEDKTIYIMMHEESQDNGDVKLRTIGKLLDQKVCIEGMVTICLRCAITPEGKHVFITNSDGNNIAKSPEGMFEKEIPNDLKAVDEKIREYWRI